MSSLAAATLPALLALPLSERLDLADMLYASLPSDLQTSFDEEWLIEAEARSAEMNQSQAAEHLTIRSVV